MAHLLPRRKPDWAWPPARPDIRPWLRSSNADGLADLHRTGLDTGHQIPRRSGRDERRLAPTGTRSVTISGRGAPMVGSLWAAGGKAAFRVSTSLRARAAPVAAVVLGVVALGLGAASVVLDSLTHQPVTGGPAADAFITAVGAVPATAVGTLLAARRPRNPIGWMLLAIIVVEIIPASQYLV